MNIFKELLSKSDSSGSKSTVLKPLTWFISVLIGGIIFFLKYDAPNWLIIFFMIIITLIVLLFLFSYVFCLFKDRDALRSEKYSIQKMAIERGLLGDNNSGLFSEKELTNINSSDNSENSN